MSLSKSTLIGFFKDGDLPSGENFRALIETMATEKSVTNLEAKVEELETPRSIEVGEPGSTWNIATHADQLRVFPSNAPSPEMPGDVNFSGLVASEGRIGAAIVQNPFDSSEPAMENRSLSDIHQTAGWQTLIMPPQRTVAFEVVVYADAGDAAGKTNILKRMLGIAVPRHSVIHAIATCAAGGFDTDITLTSSPFKGSAIGRLVRTAVAMIIALLAFAIWLHSKSETIPNPITELQNFAELGLTGLSSMTYATIFAGLVFVRECIVVITRKRASPTLRWRPTGFNPLKPMPRQLQIRPAAALSPSSKRSFLYAVTRLWN